MWKTLFYHVNVMRSKSEKTTVEVFLIALLFDKPETTGVNIEGCIYTLYLSLLFP